MRVKRTKNEGRQWALWRKIRTLGMNVGISLWFTIELTIFTEVYVLCESKKELKARLA